ncbi:MAG: MarR family transcriptional regulator [Acidimicrobiales bacterium]|nr:MarR family transcriptional regulator [Actinomycetes bacterium]MDP6159890.1 MarR family transcriptional regulator [Acidimicrobiales bacterium]HCW00920.1 MarR family transcriptional regulator [Acidimicrobiaceae bacterium]MDP6286320.1 MarR family transcriptional regulator [Acidimicrobiales bacterium]MDP6911769.1 MarR family transcriptional regulator [Acidimicrobiales bacterium]
MPPPDAPLPFDPISEARRNWEARGWGAVDAMAAATSITRAHQILLKRIDTTLESFDLMFSRFEALALLSFTRTGTMPMGRMGERLQVHPTSVTNTVDRLEAQGLVARIPHPTDRRTTLVEITPAGRTRVERAAAALGDVGFGLDGMKTSDLTAVTNSLHSLRAAAGDF